MLEEYSELIASNTLVFSNFSRGIKTFFGDIVFCSDSGKDILERYFSLTEKQKEQIKLIGLRKIFSEHTYQNRLEYVLSKTSINYNNDVVTNVLVTSIVNSESEALSIIDNFSKQLLKSKKLILISDKKIVIETGNDIEIIFIEDLEQHFFEEFASFFQNICYFHHECIYGANYLIDVVNGSKYSNGLPVSKLCIDEYSEVNQIPFTIVDEYLAASTLIPVSTIMNKPVIPNLRRWRNFEKSNSTTLLIDCYDFWHKQTIFLRSRL